MYPKHMLVGCIMLLAIAVSLGATEKPKSASSPKVDKAAIDRLVRQLGSEGFKEREVADKALRAIGNPALSALREAQKDRDPEVRRRAAELVRAIMQQRAVMREKAWHVFLEKNVIRCLGAPGGSLPSDGQLKYLWFWPGKACNEEYLSWLPWFDDAESVYLSENPITDDQLRYLETFSRMDYLNLGDTKVTDAGLAHLKNCRSLEQLILSGTQVTGAGLVHLKETNLHELFVGGVPMNDAGLAHVKELKKLTSLSLGSNPITDAGLDHILELPKLLSLYLSNTKVTDKGLAKLKGLRNLKRLYLRRIQVTDKGILELKKLQNLEILYLDGTQVTEAGIAELLKALPRIRWIHWEDKGKPRTAKRGFH